MPYGSHSLLFADRCLRLCFHRENARRRLLSLESTALLEGCDVADVLLDEVLRCHALASRVAFRLGRTVCGAYCCEWYPGLRWPRLAWIKGDRLNDRLRDYILFLRPLDRVLI